MEQPKATDVEKSVLASLLICQDVIGYDKLNENHFYNTKHRAIFREVNSMLCDGLSVDAVIISQKLEGKVEGDYILELCENTFATDVSNYVQVLDEYRKRREMLKYSQQITNWCMDIDKQIDSIILGADKFVTDINTGKGSDPMRIGDILKDTIKQIEKGDYFNAISTGYGKLDNIIGGYKNSEFIVIAGRPSMGKSAFVLNSVMSEKVNKKVLFLTFEMSFREIIERTTLVHNNTKIDKHVNVETLRKIANEFKKYDIYIDDCTDMTIYDIKAKALKHKKLYGLDMIVVDYIQLVKARDRRVVREQQIAEVSRGAKLIAKQLGVPFIGLAQLSRECERRENKRPMMSDLRESGTIEQDADIVMFVYRDEVYNSDSPDRGLAELIVRKNRNGPTGSTKLGFTLSNTVFHNIDVPNTNFYDW